MSQSKSQTASKSRVRSGVRSSFQNRVCEQVARAQCYGLCDSQQLLLILVASYEVVAHAYLHPGHPCALDVWAIARSLLKKVLYVPTLIVKEVDENMQLFVLVTERGERIEQERRVTVLTVRCRCSKPTRACWERLHGVSEHAPSVTGP